MPTDYDAEEQKRRRKELDEIQFRSARRAEAQAPIQDELLAKQLEAARLQAAQAKTQQEILDNNLKESRERANKELAKRRNPETFISGGDGAYPWSVGMLYVGRDPKTGQEVGAFTDVHALTVGASGYGKGASTIIQNLLRWPNNTITIDAKGGENAILTAVKRADKFNQEVFILDPFERVPTDAIDHPNVKKVGYNPLDDIDLYAPQAKRQLKAIASGLIIRDNSDDEFWQRGAENILTGMLAALIEDHGRNASLSQLRNVIRELAKTISDDLDKVDVDQSRAVQLVAYLQRFENDFTTSAIAEIMSPQGESYLSGVISSTGWLDEPAHAKFLERTSGGFHLNAIKNRACNIYLVLPSEEVADSRIFLRLFVKLLMKEIQAHKGGRDILFILDEFRQLGRLDEVAEKFGIFREFNCTLWPMLQNWSQLENLYGRTGATEIRGDCRIAEFFSADDPNTSEYVCREAGWNKQTEQPLLRPNEYAELIAKEDPRGLARRKLVFMPGKPRLICVKPQGWWNDESLKPKSISKPKPETSTSLQQRKPRSFIDRYFSALYDKLALDYPTALDTARDQIRRKDETASVFYEKYGFSLWMGKNLDNYVEGLFTIYKFRVSRTTAAWHLIEAWLKRPHQMVYNPGFIAPETNFWGNNIPPPEKNREDFKAFDGLLDIGFTL